LTLKDQLDIDSVFTKQHTLEKPLLVLQKDLRVANLVRSSCVRRTTEVPGEAGNVFDVGTLRVRGEIPYCMSFSMRCRSEVIEVREDRREVDNDRFAKGEGLASGQLHVC
jgi:hypothetical protein